MTRVLAFLEEVCIVWYNPIGPGASHGFGLNDNHRPILTHEFDTLPYQLRKLIYVVEGA